MTRKIIYPSWLTEDDLDRIRSMSSPTASRSLDECQSQLHLLSNYLDKFPEKMKLFSIKNYYPTEELLTYYTKKFDAVIHLCECWSMRWLCHHAYRMKGHLDLMKESMEAGNWTVACSLLRNIIEEIACFDFNMGKISKEFSEILEIQKQIKVNKGEGNSSDRDLNQMFVLKHIDMIELMSQAIYRTSIDWEELMKKISDECGIDYEKLSTRERYMPKKVNIMTAIDKMDKRYSKKFRGHYCMLSELLHPNFGANMLVIESAKEFEREYEFICMSSNIRTIAKAKLFFDISSELIASAFKIENDNLKKAQDAHELFMDMCRDGSFIYREALVEVQ